MVALKIQTSSFPITIISAYSSPAQNVHTTLLEIQEIISSLPEEKIIIGADLNGHNTLWGYRSNDNRGKDILDFILANNLNIINKPDALPTFYRNNSVGWPDLTLCSQSLIDSSINWELSLPSVWDAVQGGVSKISFPISNPVLDKRRPKGKSARGSTKNPGPDFPFPCIPTNYNLTTATQPPDPPSSPQEISAVIEHLPAGKAPGIDGIDNLLIKIIHKRFNNIFSTLFNKCLHLSCFPDSLKIGNIILFQKGGKDQRLASSYHPISFLPTIGKVLEKRMTQRLTYHLESTNSLNDRQHGFREGKSVDTAINELLRKIETARRDSKHVLVLSIDIKGAFDNLQLRAILKSLEASACPSNINRHFHSLLQNRKVTLMTPQGRATKDQKQGCPQGSCSGPALWNLVAIEILNQVWPDNVHIQAFSDDFVLVIKADTSKSLVEDTQSVKPNSAPGAQKMNLPFQQKKTNYILFRKMVRSPKITWNGYKINRVKSFKYLGIHVDDRLNWLENINK
ncbi:Retrovirus-related Pol polyprotein from type-1 retrotransposable element R1 [Araneus ventricosus]|uniref:Retrovirus-related Pol polyprotein from type-1 retrotransposable element R1 n=1 Tax=Araneus ventricosus TaxID=182803 RepID=A0A4Y2D4M9_ARAVE|nr:Retrovirus-related Pol polyprotein from type-1 retrotransposable element R1 [Araneus ventricosus]